jgi:aspartyl-tRNA(Asn)/glutamyl-tRNA(Gln) amidotransferase subunit C
MEVNCETIKHLAQLSNFSMSDKQAEKLTGDLKNIINYISELDKLDTDGVPPTYQVFEMENVWRDDEILPQDADREQLLALTKEEKDHQIKVPKVL